MFIFNIVLAVILAGAGIFLLFLIRKNLALSKIHKTIGDELLTIIQEIAAAETENQKSGYKPKPTSGSLGTYGADLIDDPVMLATLMTAIVNKYGDVKVSMDDFNNLTDDKFISVYVDTQTQELILSLNPDLVEAREMAFENFFKSDDGTYH